MRVAADKRWGDRQAGGMNDGMVDRRMDIPEQTSGDVTPLDGSRDLGCVRQVAAVNWKGHTKRLRLEPGGLTLDVPLSACVTKGDRLRSESGDVWVIGKNGDCKILQPYIVPDVVNLGGVELEVLVKEVTEEEEHVGYQALADYHYRGKAIHGRTARLIVRTFHPRVSKGAWLH